MDRLLRSSGVRLTAMAAGLFAACTLALCILIYLGLRDDMEDQLRAQIRNETSQLIGDYNDDGLEELRHDISERLERHPGNRLRYTLTSPGGISIFDRIDLPERGGWSRLKQEGASDLIVLTTPLDDGYRLGIGADTRIVGEAARALRHAMLVVVIPALLLSLVAGLLVSRRFLARVENMKSTAEAVGRKSLSARMPVSPSGDEFDSLAGTINQMLDRIEALVRDVRYVSASIAHDLRTPLGHLRQRLERLVDTADTPAQRDELAETTALLDDVLATFAALLKIAELESRSTPVATETIDLSEIAGRVVSTFAAVAEAENKSISLVSAEPVYVVGDAQLITQMLVNLVENALRHNQAGVHVEVSVSRDEGAAQLLVRDDGVGIPEGELENAIKPFHRLDRSRTTTGSGLGLSLAASIARHHGAELHLTKLEPGLEVRCLFPRPA
ncbi:HAMP domain-containing sensor histidine kinase [Henriciella algicola]|uniref:histidine kinase n=1 Tax=Henriciella algicola TaxID=1608422 RepID=A0A399R7V4_9PROT|nr:HAMP domain-containing sensor histidine kinase [Henriciella algicola]RIJ27468.1 sensor histidine kinase [Henriciella algicola]